MDRTTPGSGNPVVKHCRDCKWLCGRMSSIGIECTNPDKREIWEARKKRSSRFCESARYKEPSKIACKMFEEKNGR